MNAAAFDVDRVRRDFPILDQEVYGKPLVYLDSGASAQKPRCVIDAIEYYYLHDHANVHRGVHALSERATRDFEGAREICRDFLNASSVREVIFTKGSTEAINLVASSFGELMSEGDEILVSEMEHHANLVPWQLLARKRGMQVRKIPITDKGELDLDAYRALLGERVRVVAVAHVSNALGTVNPVAEITRLAHEVGAVVCVDGAQAVPHQKVDVQELDCDFYAFSGHKVYGPTGIGVLYGKEKHLDDMPPYQSGGEMIKYVSFERTEFNDLPHKFEAGTPNIADAHGLGVALDYVRGLGLDAIAAHEADLLSYATDRSREIDSLRIVGTAREKAGILSFLLEGIHPHDIGTIIDHQGVAVRTGHHCAMPVMQRFGLPATVRASFGMYNTRDDVDRLIDGINKVIEVFNPS